MEIGMARVQLWYTDDLGYEYGIPNGREWHAVDAFGQKVGDSVAIINPGWRPREPKYTLVHTYDSDDDDADVVCNAAFARFNRGSGREDPALDEKKLRSLSMGDIVKITRFPPAGTCILTGADGENPDECESHEHESVAYVCADSGWRPVESWEIA